MAGWTASCVNYTGDLILIACLSSAPVSNVPMCISTSSRCFCALKHHSDTVRVRAVVWLRLPLTELSAASEICHLNLQRLGDFDGLAAWGGRGFGMS